MTRIHAFVIAVAVAFAVVAGAFAAFRTTQLGTTSTARVSPVVLAAESRKLDQSASAVHRALRMHPPALPRVPKVKRPVLPTGTPPAVVHVVHVAAASTTTTAALSPTATRPAASTRVATTTSARTTTVPTATTAQRSHERETGEHETGGDDTHEHTTTTTTTTTTTPADD